MQQIIPHVLKKTFRKRESFRDETVQYGINREAAKISALLSGKIDKYEFLRGEEILSSDQSRIIG